MSAASGSVIRVGTRASALAMAQTRQIADRIAAAAKAEVELVPVTTEGDTSRASLASLGGTGVFVTALREALLEGRCDVVVHSMKDLPTAEHEGLRLGAVPKRADARDALCARDGLTLATLPEGARVGTGSPRRIAQLRAVRPDLEVLDIRGNIDTRLGRVASGDPSTGSGEALDAVLLAAAGLGRLGRSDAATELLSLDDWPTAAAQGALAIEVRRERGDRALEHALEAVDHRTSRAAALAERLVLAGLEAGCAAPVGVTAFLDDELLFLSATVYSADGTRRITSSHAATPESRSAADLAESARDVADRAVAELLGNGAAELAAAIEETS
ncbi:hydroxymethylbilane synthase [Agromyces terreus]|uniref:Hydroxymethylbilane synthase n=1 Tax=Agromyces terreus TaxID=424795 RepID=A0A9X2GZ87_9MICO|nr:hydroxymethylbilane synthase [Agromyces terreus]MCP2370206.1 hydroxymethylbilane synthase [Agromyces terreus]